MEDRDDITPETITKHHTTKDISYSPSNTAPPSLWEMNGKILPYIHFMYYYGLCLKKPPILWKDVSIEEIIHYKLLTDIKGKHAIAQTTRGGDLYVKYLDFRDAKRYYLDVILRRRREVSLEGLKVVSAILKNGETYGNK